MLVTRTKGRWVAKVRNQILDLGRHWRRFLAGFRFEALDLVLGDLDQRVE